MDNKLAEDGKYHGPALSHMRDTVFGKDMVLHIHRVCTNSEKMRDDQGLLDAAVAKRARKAAKRVGK